MLFTAIATSDDIDIADALTEVITDCRRQLAGRSAQAGILFASCMDADFEEALEVILSHFPGLQLIGCTSDGEFTPATGFIEDSLSLMLLSSDPCTSPLPSPPISAATPSNRCVPPMSRRAAIFLPSRAAPSFFPTA
jgi:small ligand-binding sensory domain FIST